MNTGEFLVQDRLEIVRLNLITIIEFKYYYSL